MVTKYVEQSAAPLNSESMVFRRATEYLDINIPDIVHLCCIRVIFTAQAIICVTAVAAAARLAKGKRREQEAR